MDRGDKDRYVVELFVGDVGNIRTTVDFRIVAFTEQVLFITVLGMRVRFHDLIDNFIGGT